MLLYLIRHAEAEEPGTGGINRDFGRPLTAHGREQSRALAAAFARRNLTIDSLAASPLVRAHQTAAEFLSILAPGIRPVTCDELAIDKLKPHRLSEFLAKLPASGDRSPSQDEKVTAAVGHAPDLCTYLEWLLGAATGTIHLAKASAACIRFKGDPGKAMGELLWLVPPEWVG